MLQVTRVSILLQDVSNLGTIQLLIGGIDESIYQLIKSRSVALQQCLDRHIGLIQHAVHMIVNNHMRVVRNLQSQTPLSTNQPLNTARNMLTLTTTNNP